MSSHLKALAASLQTRFDDRIRESNIALDELTIVVAKKDIIDVTTVLKDEFAFDQLIDLCGVDYSTYGNTESSFKPAERFAVIYHLLSVRNNHRLRVRTFLPDEAMPRIASINTIWNAANWFEREAFDLYGFIFEGHDDLRRLLTDYGFIGHPFRKDFPLEGNVEMRYDSVQQRVIYEPVSIEERNLVPRVIRRDNRYHPSTQSGEA